MSSGTKTSNKMICFDIKLVGVTNTAILPPKTPPHQQGPAAHCLAAAQNLQLSVASATEVQHYSSCISGELK